MTFLAIDWADFASVAVFWRKKRYRSVVSAVYAFPHDIHKGRFASQAEIIIFADIAVRYRALFASETSVWFNFLDEKSFRGFTIYLASPICCEIFTKLAFLTGFIVRAANAKFSTALTGSGSINVIPGELAFTALRIIKKVKSLFARSAFARGSAVGTVGSAGPAVFLLHNMKADFLASHAGTCFINIKPLATFAAVTGVSASIALRNAGFADRLREELSNRAEEAVFS